ncbi:TetR/AcrR family transcriptional regulator [Hamadaea tsunoensis]|uniref:TetR/AcrR family transcriptional regulator n=1 Tax=Hamadaea tsunoensis TaxID=53368 RepID=UPI0004874E51|nr:TetR/AcrR family transcriptional regulator [Hamadaea tsunoensis]
MPEDTRTSMIKSAARLFQERGYEGTSFQDVLARSGAPRGSIYHHFPGGKEELAAEALRWYAQRTREELGRSENVAEAVAAFLAASRRAMEKTGFVAGCPVAGVALDLADAGSPLHRVVAESLSGWLRVLTRALEREGRTPDQARSLATFVIAAIEGALLLSRTERSAQPIDDVSEHLLALLRL